MGLSSQKPSFESGTEYLFHHSMGVYVCLYISVCPKYHIVNLDFSYFCDISLPSRYNILGTKDAQVERHEDDKTFPDSTLRLTLRKSCLSIVIVHFVLSTEGST